MGWDKIANALMARDGNEKHDQKGRFTSGGGGGGGSKSDAKKEKKYRDHGKSMLAAGMEETAIKHSIREKFPHLSPQEAKAHANHAIRESRAEAKANPQSEADKSAAIKKNEALVSRLQKQGKLK